MTVAGFEWLKTKYETPEGKALLEKARKLGELADSLDIPLAQLSLAWCLKNPNVSTVILGASRIEQLEQNLDALDIVPRLTPEVLAKIETCVDNRPAAPERF